VLIKPLPVSVAIPTLPECVMRTLSVPSVVTFICPSEPVSMVSTFVLPVSIFVLSTDIPDKFEPSPLNVVAVTIPDTMIPVSA